MKKLFLAAAVAAVLAGCGNNRRQQNNNVTIENNTTSGFDVNRLAQMVKTSTDPQVLEKAINDPNNQINNLDLDKDGNIDYLKVTEPTRDQLNVVDDISNNNSVTVASIKIDPTGNSQANLDIQGNPTYVGDNYTYHSTFSLTDFLLMSYFLRPHAYYVPAYHYGYYPSYYTRTRVVTRYRTTPTTRSAPTAANQSYNRSSLSNPTRSQRSFSTRDNSQQVRSGGFGSKTSTSTSSYSSGSSSGGFGSSSSHSSSSFGSSSHRSFGGSHSGFGRRR